MTVAFLGEKTVAAAIPVFATAVATLDLPALQAELAGLTQLIFQVGLTPPSIGGTLQFAAELAAQAALSIVPPALQIVADLQLKIPILEAQIALIIQLTELIAKGGLKMYSFDGASNLFGSELASTLAGPEVDGGLPSGSQTFAVVLLATATAPINTLKVVFST